MPRKIWKYSSSSTEVVRFGMEWISLPLRALVDYGEEFTTSVKASNSPPPEERYKQEKALFGFFVNAASAIECFFYSAYCMASILNPDTFRVSKSHPLIGKIGDKKAYACRSMDASKVNNVQTEGLNIRALCSIASNNCTIWQASQEDGSHEDWKTNYWSYRFARCSGTDYDSCRWLWGR